MLMMEVVAAAASVAGILSLVGQSISGVQNLLDLYSDVASAHKTIEHLIRDINAFLRTLFESQRLINKIPNDVDKFQFVSLEVQLEDCAKDVQEWLKVARDFNVALKGGKMYLQKLAIAMHKNKLERTRTEIDRNRHTLTTSLAVLGRWLDIHTSRQVRQVDEKMGKANATFTDGLRVQDATLERIENYSRSGSASAASSAGSLQSMASSLSKLEARVASLTEEKSQRLDVDQILEAKKAFSAAARVHPFYNLQPGADGLYHCPYANTQDCSHKPEKVKCNYEKNLDSHIKPYRCRLPGCEDIHFSSTARLRNHERELHSVHAIGEESNLCPFADCDRSENGYSLHRNLFDHMKRVHNYPGSMSSSSGSVDSHISRHLTGPSVLGKSVQDPKPTTANEELPVRQDKLVGEKRHQKSARLEDHWSGKAIGLGISPQTARRLRKAAAGFPQVLSGFPEIPLDSRQQQLQVLSQCLYPPCIVHHIALRQRLQSCKGYSNVTNMLCAHLAKRKVGAQDDEASEMHDDALDLRHTINEAIENLGKDLQASKTACIQAGYSTYEIDTMMADVSRERDSIEQTTQPEKNLAHEDMLRIRKHTLDSSLLDGWSSTRDRINRWLLHSLRSDDRQAQLHRSMLAEPDVDEESWARLVLKFWNLDEAATGKELGTSLSVGAVDSRDQSQSEIADFFSCLELAEAEAAQEATDRIEPK